MDRPITLYDNSERSSWVLMLYIFGIGGLIVGLFVLWKEHLMLAEVVSGVRVPRSEIEALITLETIVMMGSGGISIISLVFFLSWFRRAYGNLHRLRFLSVEHEEVSAVYAWFIPILNLFRPVQIMFEIWNKTQDGIAHFDSQSEKKDGDALIIIWWMLVVFIGLGHGCTFIMLRDESVENLILTGKLLAFFDVISIIKILVLMWIVYTLSKMEERLFAVVKKNGGRVVQRN